MTSAASGSASFKELRRATEIVGVLFRWGFGSLLSRPALRSAGVEAEDGAGPAEVRGLPRGERLVRALEELGPTFVKAGQILSTRADIVPADVADALKRLQDRAEPLPFATIRGVVEAELGRPLGDLFETFDEVPLATASIAQVHRATLRQGEERAAVVCKVQRPGIQETVQVDMSLLRWLSRLSEQTIDEASAYSPSVIVEQFERAIGEEMDFVHELANLERARRNFASRPDLLVVPEAFPQLCTGRVLTMRYLEGRKITDLKDDPGADLKALRDRLVETAFKQVFEDGYFHGDPHPGNILVLEDGRLGILDHGLWGRITAEQRSILLHWLTAIALKSPSTLARLTLRVGKVPPGFDRAAYERDVRDLMDKYVGVELESLDAAGVIADSIEAVRKHRIKLPPDFAVLARATATLEGIVRELYPDLDVQEVLLPYVQRLILQRFDPTRVGPGAVGLLFALQTLTEEVPAQLEQLLSDLSSGRFQLGLRAEALEDLAAAGRVHGVRLALAVLCGASLVAAAIALAPFTYTATALQLPLVGLLALLGAGWLFGLLLLTFAFPRGPQKLRLSWLRPLRRGKRG